MNILGIDSSSKNLSVAISRDDKLLSEAVDYKGSGHIVNIIAFIDKVLLKTNISLKDIDIFGVNLGPGDFTGTRIGVSVVKTLSWIESRSAYGINSLDVYAVMSVFENKSRIIRGLLSGRPVIIAPCLDVKKSEICFSFYNVTAEGKNSIYFKSEKKIIAAVKIKEKKYYLERIGDYYLVHKDKLVEKFNNFFKNGVLKIMNTERGYINPLIIIGGNSYINYKDIMQDLTRTGKGLILDKKSFCLHARYINLCSYLKALKNVKSESLVPIYIREFIPFGD